MNFDLHKHTILLNIAGSRSYGIHRHESDIDVKGVCIPPSRFIIGCLSKFEQVDSPSHIATFESLLSEEQMKIVRREKLEGTVYTLQKFLRLAADSNPNIIESLFCREQELLLCTKEGEILRENRKLFLSAKAKHTFSGYAFAQLNRIKRHRSWLLNPPAHKPTRSDFGLSEFPDRHFKEIKDAIQKKMDSWEWDFGTLSHSEILALKERLNEQMSEMKLVQSDTWQLAASALGASSDLIHKIIQEKKYLNAMQNWKQFQSWKRARNPKRAVLEEKYGYDTKHATHLVRLLRMGAEIMETGDVHVWRGGIDAEELCHIRAGGWPYEKLVEWAEQKQKELNERYKTAQGIVPNKPDIHAIDELCVRILQKALSKRI